MKKIVVGVVCGILNGLLGSGGGVAAVISLRKFFKLETHRCHATAIAIILPLTLVSAAIYLFKYDVELMTALWVTVGGIAGGIAGAKWLAKISARWLHLIFGGIMIFAAVRMFFA
ncbi:MAG: TSUP family transporter [Defluviitaleaceae bacterium]|nr:TSUP family transporter [Defluviitaleaceae bacterium]